MPALKVLKLSCHIGSASGIPAWNILANIPKFPNLEELVLHGCNMTVHDMASFILKQTDTLRVLDLSLLSLHEGTIFDMSMFYFQLSAASSLNQYQQDGLALVTVTGNGYLRRDIRLPRHLCLPYTNVDENEDGYIEVVVLGKVIYWKEQQDVKDMLSDLSVCLF